MIECFRVPFMGTKDENLELDHHVPCPLHKQFSNADRGSKEYVMENITETLNLHC